MSTGAMQDDEDEASVAGHGAYNRSGVDLSTRRFLDGIQTTDISVFYQDSDLHYLWVENPADGYKGLRSGKCDEDVLPETAARALTAMKRQALDEGRPGHMMLEVAAPDQATRWFDVWVEPDRTGSETADQGLLGFSVEVTERVEREERLRVLLREVSHRSRNLLAIVQSIASQTAQGHALGPDDRGQFLERFNERLQSLAHTLDIVTLRDWEGATLHQLISRQTGPFVPSTGVVEIGGSDPVLTPNAALHIGLAMQELASNAASHGVWSRSDGMVYVHTLTEGSGSDLVLEWREAVGTMARRAANDDEPSMARDEARSEWIADSAETARLVGDGLIGRARRPQTSTGSSSGSNDAGAATKRASFGSRTLMRIVPAAVGGQAKVTHEGSNFVYRLSLPASNFEATG